MVLDALSILVVFGVTIIVGYVGGLIFDKTKIPDVIWLLIFGMLISSFGFVDQALFLAITPLLAALAILLILFDAGLNMNIYQLIRQFPHSISIAVTGMALSMGVTAVMAIGFFGFDLLRGLLLGAILGGISSPVVIGIVSRLNIKSSVKTILNLDSILTDPLVIVVSIALINAITLRAVVSSPIRDILTAFSIGAVVGVLIGLVWLFALDKLRGKPFDYMLTLSALFLVYVGVELTGGSGAIAALAFGLVLGNGGSFSTMLKFRKRFTVDSTLKHFHNEVSFFIRSFFFVFLGIVISINQTFLLYGIAISAALVIVRVITIQITTFRMKLASQEKNMMRIMTPRGLAAAVMSQLPGLSGIPGGDVFSKITFVVILATVIYTSVATKVIFKLGSMNAKKAARHKPKKRVADAAPEGQEEKA